VKEETKDDGVLMSMKMGEVVAVTKCSDGDDYG